MPSLTSSITPSPLPFRSILHTVEYSWINDWYVGKFASNFVSLIIRISILPPMSDKSYSNLFLTEFISRCPMIILQEYLTWRFFSPIIMSSWRSSGPGFMEIVSDSGLLVLLRQLPLMLTSFLEFKKHSKLRIPEIRFLGKIEELVLCGDHIHQNAIPLYSP